ncbi:Uncharacterized protein OBRU01_04445 [Operophtera brumata]|uniref:Uncharacterized protein n=1 Tax=Operophtera brumata TaxID=104452 RepID=A0A0L7LP81_OPEBR|nr:Uncharacterized protein OBRU01_04445 [Operophtera brumata]
MDDALDRVPVRQSRNETADTLNINNPIGKHYDKQSFHAVARNETYVKSDMNYPSASNTKIPDVPKLPKNFNPATSSPFLHKTHLGASKPTDALIRKLHSSLRLATDDTEGSTENSLSISKIADYLDMLKLNKNLYNKKQPLTERHMNVQESQVTNLRDSRKMETASSSGTVNTVIAVEKLNVEANVPAVVVTHHHTNEEDKAKRSTRSKSPSSKSQTTLSTVQECENTSHVCSPNIEYRELDKSVDWREVLQQKRHKQDRLSKEKWADISASSAHGFVGVNCAVTVTVTTVIDSWLTATLKFDELPDGPDFSVELPRLPLLLSPGKSEQLTMNITSNVEMNTTLPFTMHFIDASIDEELQQRGTLDLNIRMPVIQAMSCDGLNKVTFPPIQENSSLIKSFVLISNCPCDLQLDLCVSDGDSIFMIRSVQEIKKCDVNKVLMDRQGVADEPSKGKSKGMNKQLFRLSSGNAIRVFII